MQEKINKFFFGDNDSKSTLRQYIEAFIVIMPIAVLIRTFGYGLYVVPSGSMETTMLVGERFVADKFTVWFSDIKRGEIISFNDATFPYSDNKFKRFIQYYLDPIWGPSNVTKRVIGIPGDHVQGVIEDGKPVIYRNGEKLDEPYVNKYPLVAVFKYDLNKLRSMSRREQENLDRLCSLKSYDPTKPFNEQPFYRIQKDRILINPETRQMFVHEPGTPVEGGFDEFDVYLKDDEYWVMGDNRLGSSDCRMWGHPLKKELIHGRIVFRIMSIDSDDSWIIFDLLKNPIDFFKRIRWSRWLQRVY